jgi:hypothetical protein
METVQAGFSPALDIILRGKTFYQMLLLIEGSGEEIELGIVVCNEMDGAYAANMCQLSESGTVKCLSADGILSFDAMKAFSALK